MTTRQKTEVLIARDEIVAPPVERACEDQSFELPGGLYAAMATMFAGFIVVLAFGFRGGHMGVAYGVSSPSSPPSSPSRRASRKSEGSAGRCFATRESQTATGRSSATEATVLVLLLPFLILCFGIAIVSIAALV